MSERMETWSASPRARLLAQGLGGGAVLAFAGLEVLNLRHYGWSALGTNFVSGVMLVLSFVGLGTLLSLRQPANPIGWLLTAAGLTWLVTGATSDFAGRAVADGHVTVAARLAASVDANLWPLGVLCSVGLPLLLFPAGRVRSNRWRWVLVAMVIVGLLLLVTFFVTPGPIVDPTDAAPTLVNPWGVDALATVAAVVTNIGLPIFMLMMLAAVVGVVARFRAAVGAERLQLRWVLTGAVLAITGMLIVYLGGLLLGLSPGVTNVAVSVGIGCLPVSFTVAILRYRLYDLDRIVSRTVSYAAVSGLLVAVYVILVTMASRLTPTGSSLTVAASTLAVAALFQPLRRRVQAIVDRRFNRSRYDASRTVEAFSLRLREQVDLQAVCSDLLGLVHDTLQPVSAGLWLRDVHPVSSGRVGGPW